GEQMGLQGPAAPRQRHADRDRRALGGRIRKRCGGRAGGHALLPVGPVGRATRAVRLDHGRLTPRRLAGKAPETGPLLCRRAIPLSIAATNPSWGAGWARGSVVVETLRTSRDRALRPCRFGSIHSKGWWHAAPYEVGRLAVRRRRPD